MSTTSPSLAIPATGATNWLSSLTRHGLWMLAIRLLGAAGVFLSHLVLARCLGITAFGEFSLALAWMQSLSVVGKLGLDKSSVRFVSEYKTRNETPLLRGFLHDSWLACALVNLLLSLGMLAVVFLLREQLTGGLFWCLIVAAVMSPLVALRQNSEACLRAVGRMSDSQVSVAIWPLLLLMMSLGIWRFAGSVSSFAAMVMQLLAFAAVSALVFRFRRRSVLSKLGSGEVQSARGLWIATSASCLLAEILFVMKGRCTIALAGAVLGREAAGLYAGVDRIAEATLLGSQTLTLVIAPYFATLFAQGRCSEIRRLMRYGQWQALGLAVPLALGVVFAGDRILSTMGEEYRTGWLLMMMMLASSMIIAYTGPSGCVLQMTGGEHTVLVVTALCAVTNIGLGVVLMPHLGTLGLGVAQVANSLVWWGGIQYGLWRHPVLKAPADDKSPSPDLSRGSH